MALFSARTRLELGISFDRVVDRTDDKAVNFFDSILPPRKWTFCDNFEAGKERRDDYYCAAWKSPRGKEIAEISRERER